MSGPSPSEVIRVMTALLTPFIGMYGLYIIAHGHYGPGGGFVGGAVLAVAVILPRLTLSAADSTGLVPPAAGPVSAAVGLAIYLACGIVPLLLGGGFLDYGQLAGGPVEPSYARYLAIAAVELGVGLAVFGAILTIYDALTGQGV